eukprot:gene57306-biopygen88573
MAPFLQTHCGAPRTSTPRAIRHQAAIKTVPAPSGCLCGGGMVGMGARMFPVRGDAAAALPLLFAVLHVGLCSDQVLGNQGLWWSEIACRTSEPTVAPAARNRTACVLLKEEYFCGYSSNKFFAV